MVAGYMAVNRLNENINSIYAMIDGIIYMRKWAAVWECNLLRSEPPRLENGKDCTIIKFGELRKSGAVNFENFFEKLLALR